MRTFAFILFLILICYLVTAFLISVLSKKKSAQADESKGIHSWIVPAIISSLVANGLLSQAQADEVEEMSFAELEAYLLEHHIFESQADMQNWLLNEPELVGTGDSVFGGINKLD